MKEIDESCSKKPHKVVQKLKPCPFFLYIRGVMYYKFVPVSETVNAAFYVQVLKHLRDSVQCVRPAL